MQKNDWSISSIVAGFVAVLVGFASSVAIVFQAATAAGASPEITASWVGILGFAMGITCIGFSWYYKAPILTAWSTPGAALLATSLQDVSLAEAVGVFMLSAVLTTALGLSGWFDKLTRSIPLPIAAAMLAGIMLKFGLDIFSSLRTSPALVLLMIAVFLLAKRLWPRYAVPFVLLAGVIFCVGQQQLDFSQVELTVVQLVWVAPAWSWSAILGVGIPLFVVTMTSQNIPGVAVLRASGYQTPVSPLLSWTGVITLFTAPFGNFSINLAAITAAICSGPEAHPDPQKRYTAGIAAGIFYLLTGVAGATVVALFAAFPAELIATVAGLALLGTIAANLATATADVQHRDAAILTLLITASGVSFFGIASAFWGLVAGLVTTGWFGWRRSVS
jgi:benzoate membrane transport protein